MDRLTAMEVFARVARLGGFAAAARELRISTTAVSRYVGQLEERLDVRLLQRTTRRVSPTEAGQAYLERCEQILADVRELEDALPAGQQKPRGRLRISAGVSFAQEQLATLMPEFMLRYPELEVELVLTDRHVDLVGEGIDVAVRIGRMPDSSLFAKRLAPCRHAVCASPSYIDKNGPLESLQDLREHNCVIDTNQPQRWWFNGGTGVERIAVEGRYRVNSAHAARDMVLAGYGIAYLPTFIAGPLIESGQLVVQLQRYQTLELTLHALYPERRYLSAGVRALLEALAGRFGEGPPWDRWLPT